MVVTDIDTTQLAHAIQISIAPVFMLAGICALLGVLTTRLNRIVDRGRKLESQSLEADTFEVHLPIRLEMISLLKRGKSINIAMRLAITSAILLCLVIIVIFLGNFIPTHLGIIISLAFIACMISLVGAFLCFLIEIHVAAIENKRNLNAAEGFLTRDKIICSQSAKDVKG
ncbi:MAG: DUF2721 domain-containing protein [Cellvibrionales bacterium]|nr:DUF2721 domain-containing protein [Cellvibrionales bacterium]